MIQSLPLAWLRCQNTQLLASRCVGDFVYVCACVFVACIFVFGAGRNMWLTALLLKIYSISSAGSWKQTCKSEGRVKRLILFVPCCSIKYLLQKCNQGYVCPLGLLVRDVIIQSRAERKRGREGERAGFAWDGLIIYIDTDDAISQLPGSLSDMFH